jgi:hypothetical protein
MGNYVLLDAIGLSHRLSDHLREDTHSASAADTLAMQACGPAEGGLGLRW